MLDGLKLFFTNGTFAQETAQAAGNVALDTLKSINPYYAAGALALGGAAFGVYKKGMPTLESIKGHAATAASWVDPREYTAEARKRRLAPGKSE